MTTMAPLKIQGTGLIPTPDEEIKAQAPGLQPTASKWSPYTQGTLAGYKNSETGQWLPGDHPEAAAQGLAPVNPQSGQAPPGPAAPPAPTPGAPAQPTSQADVLNTTSVAGAQTPQGAPTTVAGAFQQALINRLAPQDISSNNPAIKGSIDANRNAEQRGLSRTQEALAERGAATGQVGAQETGLRQAIGESAGRQGAFEGNALFGLHQQQANDLTSALGMGGQLLSDQQKQDLQRYGLDLDATLRREGLGAQTQLGNRELDIRDSLGQGNLGLGYAGLLQGGDQFNKNLSGQLGIEQARLNMQSLLGLLQGI